MAEEKNNELEFEFEEKEQYTHEEVQGLLSDFKGEVKEIIKGKDKIITGATVDSEKLKELQEGNHLLQVKNLAVKNGIDEDMLDLVFDEDIEVVENKIEKLKSVTKEKNIDESYKPEKKRSEDAYEKAINDKDVKGALKNKFGRLFG